MEPGGGGERKCFMAPGAKPLKSLSYLGYSLHGLRKITIFFNMVNFAFSGSGSLTGFAELASPGRNREIMGERR